ncbi:MAG: hypothetical protein AAF642_19485 [Pseudomonadota bacterium]
MKHWLFILAGLAALAVTLIRAILGAAVDLTPLLAALEGNSLRGVVIINWHAMTAIFAIIGVALLLASRLSSAAQIAIGSIGASVFGVVCVTFMTVTAMETGSPFTYPPFIPLGIASGLSAAAAWFARA